MKKYSVIVKEASEGRIKEGIASSGSVFIVTYSKLSSPDMSSLRQTLRGAKAKLFVTKNSIARRALKEAGLENLTNFIHGPCGLIFINDEPVTISKFLCDFTKDHEQLKLEGGILDNRLLETKDIQALAKLPTKDVLRAQVVIGLKSPITGCVMVLKGTLRKFVYCLQQIKDKKGS